MDPHEVVAILFQYLWELPEPLFTDEMQHAFVACGQVRRSSDQPSQQQPQQHLRSVKVLIDDLPASHKPLLERLLHLFSRALLPEFSQVNGLDIKKLALQLAPLTLRHAREFQWSDLDDASTRRYPVTGHMPIRNRFPLNFYEPGMEQQQVRLFLKSDFIFRYLDIHTILFIYPHNIQIDRHIHLIHRIVGRE